VNASLEKRNWNYCRLHINSYWSRLFKTTSLRCSSLPNPANRQLLDHLKPGVSWCAIKLKPGVSNLRHALFPIHNFSVTYCHFRHCLLKQNGFLRGVISRTQNCLTYCDRILYWMSLFGSSTRFILFTRQHLKLVFTNWKYTVNTRAKAPELLCFATFTRLAW
jgi:hypothetical protein